MQYSTFDLFFLNKDLFVSQNARIMCYNKYKISAINAFHGWYCCCGMGLSICTNLLRYSTGPKIRKLKSDLISRLNVYFQDQLPIACTKSRFETDMWCECVLKRHILELYTIEENFIEKKYIWMIHLKDAWYRKDYPWYGIG